jgi:hypothetical protein
MLFAEITTFPTNLPFEVSQFAAPAYKAHVKSLSTKATVVRLIFQPHELEYVGDRHVE